MAFPTPLADGRPYRLTFKFNSERWGWTENVLLYSSGTVAGDNEFLAIQQYVTAWLQARKVVLSDSARIMACTVSKDDQRFDAWELTDTTLGFGPGLVSGAAAPVYLGWRFREEDSTTQVKGDLIYRGFSTAQVANLAAWGPGQPVPPAITAFSNAMNPLYVNARPAVGSVTVQAAMKSWQRNPAQAPVAAFKELGVNARGYLTVTGGSELQLMIPRTYVQLSVDRNPCLRGLSGKHRVITNTGGDGEFQITLNKKPCCGTNALLDATGTVQRVADIYVDIASYKLISPIKRDTGGAFFVGRGRSSKRCC